MTILIFKVFVGLSPLEQFKADCITCTFTLLYSSRLVSSFENSLSNKAYFVSVGPWSGSSDVPIIPITRYLKVYFTSLIFLVVGLVKQLV